MMVRNEEGWGYSDEGKPPCPWCRSGLCFIYQHHPHEDHTEYGRVWAHTWQCWQCGALYIGYQPCKKSA